MTIFAFGTYVFFNLYQMPKDAMEVYVVGKQWMWKMQHSTGQREINELHVPVGRKVKLIMTTEDVIHDVYDTRHSERKLTLFRVCTLSLVRSDKTRHQLSAPSIAD